MSNKKEEYTSYIRSVLTAKEKIPLDLSPELEKIKKDIEAKVARQKKSAHSRKKAKVHQAPAKQNIIIPL